MTVHLRVLSGHPRGPKRGNEGTRTPRVKRKEKKKIDKARKRGYITRSFMHSFSVPKGDDDIRMVYDGSRSGLNQVL